MLLIIEEVQQQEELHSDDLDWLLYNKEPFDLVKAKWSTTHEAREPYKKAAILKIIMQHLSVSKSLIHMSW